jgi:hypothetical protein
MLHLFVLSKRNVRALYGPSRGGGRAASGQDLGEKDAVLKKFGEKCSGAHVLRKGDSAAMWRALSNLIPATCAGSDGNVGSGVIVDVVIARQDPCSTLPQAEPPV